jgi:drug/metabolite transporter (DMT)-like permease
LQQKSDFGTVLIGGAWIFAAAFVYALYYLGVAELVGKVGSLRLTGLAGMFSCGWVLLHFVLFGQTSQLVTSNAGVWGNALLMALLSTVLPIYWLALAIQRLGAGPAAAAGSIGPVLTLFAAWLLLGESVSLLQLAGMALVMLGVARIKR